MDAGPFITPLISVVTTALISTVLDPIGKAFENRTKRVQFWKTMLETSPLADVTDVSFYKEQCRHEMTEAADVVAAMSNKFVGDFSLILLFGIGYVVLATMARTTTEMLNRMQGVPAAVANQLGYVSALIQAAVISTGWFWGRWRLRRWVWAKIKPGARFDVLLRNRRLQGAVGLIGLFSLLAVAWFSTIYIMFPR